MQCCLSLIRSEIQGVRLWLKQSFSSVLWPKGFLLHVAKLWYDWEILILGSQICSTSICVSVLKYANNYKRFLNNIQISAFANGDLILSGSLEKASIRRPRPSYINRLIFLNYLPNCCNLYFGLPSNQTAQVNMKLHVKQRT